MQVIVFSLILGNNVKIKSAVNVCFRQTKRDRVKHTKKFINAIVVDSAKFRNETHFVSLAICDYIVATRNGTESSNVLI
jgi:hypothetical protein